MASSQISSSLPTFAEKEYVDVARTEAILGVSWQTVVRLAQTGMLDLMDLRPRGWKKVRYGSIVDFCDRLRQYYLIPDRRPALSAPYLRHRDVDLLPFPLSITMCMSEALQATGLADRRGLRALIEEGRFEAYRLMDAPGVPWRISRPSFTEYLAEVHRNPAPDHAGSQRLHRYGRPGFSPESSL